MRLSNNCLRIFLLCAVLVSYSGCTFYRFSSASIPLDVRTIFIDQVLMETDFVDIEFGPSFTQRFIDLTNNRTRLVVQNTVDSADWVLTGFVTRYNTELAGNQDDQVMQTTLNVALKFTLLDNVNEKTNTYDVSEQFVATGDQTIFDMQDIARDDLIQRLSDKLFNSLYANW